MLVVQRGVGASLVIDVARMAVREIRQSERRIERLIHDALRLPLAALTIERVSRELVVALGSNVALPETVWTSGICVLVPFSWR